MDYKTPKEFADYIKRERYQYEIEPDDIENRIKAIKKHYENDIDQLNYSVEKEFNEINTKFQDVIDKIVQEFINILPHDIQVKFQKHFYFSTVDNRSINASVIKAPKKAFAVVLFNSSLITLLTKLGKLDIAIQNPSCIVYCNRYPDSIPTQEQVKLMRDEMYSYFMECKMSHGPYLIIKGNEAIFHFSKLNIQEKLIVFHEIAHFINGDLSKKNEQKDLIDPFKNLSHQREIMADLVGFGLLLFVEKSRGDISIERRLQILFAIIGLFDVMSGLQKVETEKYPLPLNRMNAIIEYYYGVDIADIVEETYHNKEAFLKLSPSICPTIKSNEDQMNKYINQQLGSAFDLDNFN